MRWAQIWRAAGLKAQFIGPAAHKYHRLKQHAIVIVVDGIWKPRRHGQGPMVGPRGGRAPRDLRPRVYMQIPHAQNTLEYGKFHHSYIFILHIIKSAFLC